MAHVFDDAILESTTSSGTGALTLVAVTGYKRFSQAVDVFRNVAIAVNDTVPYAIWAVDATGARTGDWETGIGTYSAANTLTRTTVLESSNSGAAVNFASSTTKYVSLTPVASKLPQFDNVGAMLMPGVSAEPPTPIAGQMYLYAKEVVPGYMATRQKGSSGADHTLQIDVGVNEVVKVGAKNATVVAIGSAGPTFTGTASAQAKASGSAKSNVQRTRYTTAATAGLLSTRIEPNANNRPAYRGAVEGEGGYRYNLRFALTTLVTGNRGFFGLAASTSASTNIDPQTAAAPARLGIGFNVNTGNWFLNTSDGTTITWTDLGATMPIDTTSLYELYLYARPYNTTASNVGYRLRRYTTSSATPLAEVFGTISTNQPAATTFIHPWSFITNNAQAAAVAWDFASDSSQSDW